MRSGGDPLAPAGAARECAGKPGVLARAALAVMIAGCSQLPPWLGLSRDAGGAVTLTSAAAHPLIGGLVVDRAGRPAAGVKVRVYEGLRVSLDGVTQTTPLDGVTQTTPLDGVTQTTPLDGVTQTTPFDGVTQTTPLQAEGVTGPDGRFGVRAPGHGVFAVEALSGGDGLVAARYGVVAGRSVAGIDLGTLSLARPGAAAGRVVGPPEAELPGIAVFVPGSDHLARTDASGSYRIAGIPAGTVRVAAVRPRYRPALASRVAITPDGVTRVPDLPLLPARPVLTRLEPDSGAVGARIRLVGSDFGPSGLAPLAVRFGSLAALEVVRAGEAEIEAVVPAGAGSGPVTLAADGVVSAPLPFTLIASVSLEPSFVRGRPGEEIALVAAAWDEAGKEIASPSLAWRAEPADLGTLSPGAFTAGRAGFGRVLAGSGVLAASADLGFGTWRAEVVIGSGLPRKGPLTGSAATVRIQYPAFLAIAPGGDLLFSDRDDKVLGDGFETLSAIRRLDSLGQVSLAVGTGEPGYDGDGAPSEASRLSRLMCAPAFASDGTMAFVDLLRVRGLVPAERDLFRRRLIAGRLWDLVGTGDPGPEGRGRDDPDGTDPRAMSLGTPITLAWDSRGHLYLDEAGQGRPASRIREIGPDGTVTTLLTSSIDSFPETTEVRADPAAFRGRVGALLPDASGNLFFTSGTRVWLYCRRAGTYFGIPARPGELVAIAGTGRHESWPEEGVALRTSLWLPRGLAFLDDGLLILENQGRRLRLLERTGFMHTIAGRGPRMTRGKIDPDAQTHLVPASRGALEFWLNNPDSISVSAAGEVFLADTGNHRILELTAR